MFLTMFTSIVGSIHSKGWKNSAKLATSEKDLRGGEKIFWTPENAQEPQILHLLLSVYFPIH